MCQLFYLSHLCLVNKIQDNKYQQMIPAIQPCSTMFALFHKKMSCATLKYKVTPSLANLTHDLRCLCSCIFWFTNTLQSPQRICGHLMNYMLQLSIIHELSVIFTLQHWSRYQVIHVQYHCTHCTVFPTFIFANNCLVKLMLYSMPI